MKRFKNHKDLIRSACRKAMDRYDKSVKDAEEKHLAWLKKNNFIQWCMRKLR